MSPHSLHLEADPQAVRVARQWVGGVFEQLGRDDLVDSASLGVSELVTNAILHADPPITVKVRGTAAHPRVEVSDTSHDRPRVNPDLAADDFLLSTVGRGLGMVAMFSATWGSEVASDGKTVWFEPTPEPHGDVDLAGAVYNLDELIDGEMPDAVATEGQIYVSLLSMPVRLFLDLRKRYNELRRELHLLVLTHREEYPLAAELSEVMVRAEQERRLSAGLEALERAAATGLDRVDLGYRAPATAPETMGRLLHLLEESDRFSDAELLLTPPATAMQRRVRAWYLGEFVRQGAGEAPRPWDGPFDLDP